MNERDDFSKALSSLSNSAFENGAQAMRLAVIEMLSRDSWKVGLTTGKAKTVVEAIIALSMPKNEANR